MKDRFSSVMKEIDNECECFISVVITRAYNAAGSGLTSLYYFLGASWNNKVHCMPLGLLSAASRAH